MQSTDASAPGGAAAARRRILDYARSRTIHLGSSLSVVDVLNAILRRGDRRSEGTPPSPLVLSKGHAVWALYALTAARRPGTYDDVTGLPGHPADGYPGVDVATGALGHGLSVAAGMCEGFRLEGTERPVHVVLGDGELDEGSVWEAAMFAAHRRLDRLVAVVDVNGLQQEGPTRDVLDLDPLGPKWAAFGWHVITVDGHSSVALDDALDRAERADGPAVVLAATVKGKGVGFMEHDVAWHTGRLDDEQHAAAVADLAGAW